MVSSTVSAVPWRRAKRLCASVTAFAVLSTGVSFPWAQSSAGNELKGQRSELARQVLAGRPGAWGLQQLLLQEAGVTPEDAPALAELRLDDAQRYAFHVAVAKLESHVRIYSTLRSEVPSTNNAAAVLQFAQAATALTQVEASRELREALQTAQDKQVRSLIAQLGRGAPQLVEGWASALRDETKSRDAVRTEVEAALGRYRSDLAQEAAAQAEKLDAASKKLLQEAEAQKDKAVEVGTRIKEELNARKRVFAVSPQLLSEIEQGFHESSAGLAAQAPAALQAMAQFEVKLRVEAAELTVNMSPLAKTQDEAMKAAEDLRTFVSNQNLSVLDAARAPLLLAQLTSVPNKFMETTAARTLGAFPEGTVARLGNLADSVKNLELDFGGLQQTGRSLNNVAGLMKAIDPSLGDAAMRVTSLVSTASSFIAVGQSVLQTVSQVSSTVSTLTQLGSFAATFFSTGGVGTALSVLSGMGGLGGLFGGRSKRDDGAILAQLNVVNQKLDQVLLNQRKTMEALVKVSEQLQEATNAILQDIQQVSLQVTRLEYADFYDAVMKPRAPCLQLYLQAVERRQFNTETGTFPAGERMRYWVEALELGQNSATENLRDCRRFLQQAAGSRVLVAPYLLDAQRKFDQKSLGSAAGLPPTLPQSAESARYNPMRDLTLSMPAKNLSLDSTCIRNAFLPQALTAPRRFDEVVALDSACTAGADIRPSAMFDDSLKNPSFVLQQMLHVNSVREFAIFVDFFAPFVDMDVAAANAGARSPDKLLAAQSNFSDSFEMLTRKAPACASPPKFGRSMTQGGEELYTGALVSVDVALAQHFLLSGAAISLQTARLLRDEKYAFGEGASVFVGSDVRKKWADFEGISAGLATGDLNADGTPAENGMEPVETGYEALRSRWEAARFEAASDDKFKDECKVRSNFSARPYEAALCVLSANPAFANNVLQALLLDEMQQVQALPGWALSANPRLAKLPPSRMSVAQYGAMLSSEGNSPLFQHSVGKGLPFVYLQGRRPGWFLKLRKHTGEVWFWRLPEPSLLASAHVYYPLSEGPLREAQALLTSRLGDYAAMCMSPDFRNDAKLLSRSALFAPPRKPLAQEALPR